MSNNSSIASINGSTGIIEGMNMGSIVLTYTLPDGCFTIGNMTVNPTPTPITGNPLICQYTTMLYAVLTPKGGNWSLKDTTIAYIDSLGGLLIGKNPGIDTITYNTYWGCSAALGITVAATPAPATGQDSICVQNSVTLSDALSGGVWSSANTGIATVGAATGIVTGLNVGTTQISYTTASGCLESTLFTVVAAPPLAFYLKPDACIGDTISIALKLAGTSIFNNYVWNFDQAHIVAANSNSGGPYLVTWNQSGTYVVQLSAENTVLCPVVHVQDTIFIHPYPNAAIQAPIFTNEKGNTFCLGDSILLRAANNNQHDFYFWQPINYFEQNNKSYVYGQIEHPGYVTLTVNDQFGCTAQDSIYLNPEPCCKLFFPNAFSPNGDGLNDVFRPVRIINQPIHSFVIVNRWGQVVYETDNLTFGWDGYFGGVPQDIGTYFYYISYDCNGVTLSEKGDITLVR